MSPISPLPRRGDGTDEDARRAMDAGAKTTHGDDHRDAGEDDAEEEDARRGVEEADMKTTELLQRLLA